MTKNIFAFNVQLPLFLEQNLELNIKLKGDLGGQRRSWRSRGNLGDLQDYR